MEHFFQQLIAAPRTQLSINQFIKQIDRSATYIDMHEIDIEII